MAVHTVKAFLVVATSRVVFASVSLEVGTLALVVDSIQVIARMLDAIMVPEVFQFATQNPAGTNSVDVGSSDNKVSPAV
jgi:hypothetical protein